MADNCWHAMTHAGGLGNTLPLARAIPIIGITAAGKSEVDSQQHMAYVVPQPRNDVGESERLWQPGRYIEPAYHVVPARGQCRSIGQDVLSNGTVRTETRLLTSPHTRSSSR